MKALYILVVGFLVITEVVANEAGDSVSENISVADAASLIEADRGGSVRSHQVAIAAVNGNRLDLVDFFLQANAHALSFVFYELRERPYSEFKEKVVIRALRSKSAWGSDDSWGSGGVTDPIPEPYLSVVTKRLPELIQGSDLLATAASRELLASRLEAAINPDSVITSPMKTKPRPTTDDVAFSGSNPADEPRQSPSSSTGQTTKAVNQTGWMNYLWLAVGVVVIATLYGLFNKCKGSSKR